jgi:predicted nucleic acid-binding protein
MKMAATRICYLDSNVLISRITPERNSDSIALHLHQASIQGFTFLTSVLAALEVNRFLHRTSNPAMTQSQFHEHEADALAGTELVRLNTQILKRASTFPFPHLGSLDSIHLGTAQAIGASHFLTRDRQLLRACDEVGIKTAFS